MGGRQQQKHLKEPIANRECAARGRRYTPKFAVVEDAAEPVEEMAAVLEAMADARTLAQRNAGFVRAQPNWAEKQARRPART